MSVTYFVETAHRTQVDGEFQPDYVVQGLRFQVLESFGCSDAVSNDVLGLLFSSIGSILMPLLSLIIYYRLSPHRLSLNAQPI